MRLTEGLDKQLNNRKSTVGLRESRLNNDYSILMH